MPAPKDPIKRAEWIEKLRKSLIGRELGFKKGHIPWDKGISRSTTDRKKMSEARMGKTWEEFYGIEKAKEMKMKRSKSMKENKINVGRKHSEKHKKNISKGCKGRIVSKKTRMRMSKSFTGRVYSIEARKKMSLAKQGLYEGENNPMYGKSGELCPAWLGGKSFEPYGFDFNDKFKEMIRARDNYCCVICNKMQEELGYKLYIHHIDYDKTNNLSQNCISLCRNHHANTNFNRQQWKTFFQSLLKERYNYEYTEDQKIILNFIK